MQSKLTGAVATKREHKRKYDEVKRCSEDDDKDSEGKR